MPFDGLMTRAAVQEIREQIVGGHVRKINQIGPKQLTFQIYAKNQNVLLYLSAAPASARIQMTEKKFKNPETPPSFVMLLRKHIGQAEIQAIDQLGLDRTVRLTFATHNELGDPVQKYLIAEIMGKYSNLILLNEEGHVIDAIQRVSHGMSRVRQIYPGTPYQPFPSGKLNILDQEVRVESLLAQAEGPVRVGKLLLRNLEGFSPLAIREVCFQAGLDPDTNSQDLSAADLGRLDQALQATCQQIRQADFTPLLYQTDKPLFYCLPLTHLGPAAMAGTSLGQVMDLFYDVHDRDDRVGQLQGNLLAILDKEIDKESRKLDRQRADYEKTLDREKYKEEGDLLASNLQRIQPGDTTITVQDYYHDGVDRVISLDPGKSAWENVERAYKRFSKLKKSNELLASRLPATQEDLAYLLQLQQSLQEADDLAVLKEIRQEFEDQGLIQKRRKQKKTRQEAPLKPLRFQSSSGKTIYVGRNNRQNDQLTLHIANKEDYFFHTQTIPGAHVILVTGGQEPSDQDILEAAWLAASHSSGRKESAVAIDYTAKKNVYKAKGAKPGMVYYRNYKTITVDPQAELQLQVLDEPAPEN